MQAAELVGPVGSAYRDCRLRITGLVADLDAQRAAAPVPACPGWSVHDVVAHLSGGIADALEGRLEGAGSDAWTAAQVERRRQMPLSEVVREWAGNAPAVEALMDGAGAIGRQAVADVVNHEHDIRGALGRPAARRSDAVLIGLGFVADRLLWTAAELDLSLGIVCSDGTRFGADPADVTLTGEPFELLRAITGRRSVEQLRAMRWQGDGDAAIPAFWWDPVHPPEVAVDE
jgi:uncharacterized protein (TIGR03083 family)